MSRVVLNEAGLHRLLESPMGPVAKFVERKASQIHSHAITNINEKIEKRTGDLLGSLRMIAFDKADGHHVAVGADATHTHGTKHGPFPYAKALELGHDPLTGRSMGYRFGPTSFSYMIPAVKQSGFVQRG